MTSAAQTPAGSKRAGAVPQAPPPGPLPDPLPHAVTGQERREPKRDNGRSEAQAPSSPERASVGEGDPRVVPAHARGARTTADSSRDALASLSRRVLQRLLVRAATSAGQTFALIRHGGVDLIETSAPVQGPPPPTPNWQVLEIGHPPGTAFGPASASTHAPGVYGFHLAQRVPLHARSGLVCKYALFCARAAFGDPEVLASLKSVGPQCAAFSCLCQGVAWSTPSDRDVSAAP